MGRRNGTEIKDERRTERREGTLKAYWFSDSGLSRSFYIIPFPSDIIHWFCQVKEDRQKKDPFSSEEIWLSYYFETLLKSDSAPLFVVVGQLTSLISFGTHPGNDVQVLTFRYNIIQELTTTYWHPDPHIQAQTSFLHHHEFQYPHLSTFPCPPRQYIKITCHQLTWSEGKLFPKPSLSNPTHLCLPSPSFFQVLYTRYSLFTLRTIIFLSDWIHPSAL